jgi:hypothetical protein
MNFYRALDIFIQGNIYFIAAHHIFKNSHTANNQTLYYQTRNTKYALLEVFQKCSAGLGACSAVRISV